ncbi:extracellular solute-binding protein [Polyangium jinanense]|uniref:Extracellular solute-binding protein n=1 Tax=Polyangium jinanense TaxID=2829994 RepID=A0A9X4AWW4_9BACT|nr:extracellular solute-binding protein [Polyangium jinanense]MDC3961879.1 extracellular solute-binding protein [Polyangium jinanense]MDC3987803.1 extracellular solute-binding protein [Polyangium jinanense]
MTVALYPFLPDYQSLFYDIEHSFERDHPDVDLQIIDLSANYYNEDEPQAITNTNAQVYELDGVFLADFIDQKRIQALPKELVPPANTMVQVAEDSAKVKNEWWGLPHWACTNYIFYRSGDPLGSAGTLKDVESLIGVKHSPDQGLLVDAKGKSTLGELYLDATLDELGDLSAAEPYLLDTNLLGGATANLQRAITLCDTGMCRDSDYHEATSFYARQFARKRGRALVGYSERLYYIALEQHESCRKGECLDLEDIEMKPLPLSDKGSHPFAWVDMLTISTTCDEKCLPDATAFIAHVTSSAEVKRSLLPARYGAPPRYLLPARTDLYTDKDVLVAAPLYSKLRPALSGAIPVRGRKLNARLRAIGKKLDKEILKP